MSLLYQQKKNLHTEYKFNPIRHSEMAWTKSIFYYVFEICVAIKMKIFEDVRKLYFPSHSMLNRDNR
ncbi:hypothetical protein T4C_6031 [Trichinella pseudospiralis]|uniref:Uncharacterized protein n=1 Tax=Trichinella pseudospiralis TaxID=6337 RepID=A0A0V1JTX5_TRIPS|nr:hypothetical protein T4C_6031 [Trichinella pseudospiralis]